MTTLSIPNWKLAPVATAKSPSAPLRSLKWNTISDDFEVKKILCFESIYFCQYISYEITGLMPDIPELQKLDMIFWDVESLNSELRNRIPAGI